MFRRVHRGILLLVVFVQLDFLFHIFDVLIVFREKYAQMYEINL